MKIAVVTASIGQPRCKLLTPAHIRPDVDYVCFTDNTELTHDVWRCVLREPLIKDSCRDAKRFKVLVHENIDADASIWIDAHCRLMCDPVEVWNDFDDPIAVIRHWRGCIYHEARACIRRGKDARQRIRAAIAGYRRHHPPRWGLFYGGCILRRHTEEVEEFNRRWWRLIAAGSRRDQLSLPVALRQSGIPFAAIDRGRLANFMQIRGKRR